MITAAVTGPVPGRREQTKAANRTAIVEAARDVFAEVGFGAASVRDIIRRTDLATGTFYNYFPSKEAVLREILEETTAEIRVEVARARGRATTVEEFVREGFRAYFEHLAADRRTLRLMSRNAGTIRAMFDEPAVGAGVEELRLDLALAVDAGLLAPHDTAVMAAAMVGAGVEVGIRMAAQDPPDVESAVAVLTIVFTAGLQAL